MSSSGFVDSSRLVTCFVYLNGLPSGGGGETRFPRLGLSIAPRRGMAVVHRPGRLDCSLDERCEHEGVAPTGPESKWVLVAQLWERPKDEGCEGVREGDTRTLTEDII